jgi:hypothetical protein
MTWSGPSGLRKVALFVLAVSTLAACGQPGGTDGNLTDDWAPLAAAKVVPPVAGECRTAYVTTTAALLSLDDTHVAPCDTAHELDVVAVAPLPDEVAKAADRPTRDKLAALFPVCEQAAAQYLGADWQNGRLILSVNPPGYAAWRGGARYYQCDVSAVADDGSTLRPAAAALKKSAAAGGPQAWGCATATGGDTDVLFRRAVPTPCTEPHDLEYAGFIEAPLTTAAPADRQASSNLFAPSCEAKILSYMHMSRGAWNRQDDVSYVWWRASSEDGWAVGEHSVRCFLHTTGRKTSRSVAGIGDVTI